MCIAQLTYLKHANFADFGVCICLSFCILIYYMTFACNTVCEMLLFVNEYFPKLCPERLTVCATFCVHPFVPLSVTVCTNGSNSVTVWQINFKVVTLIHWNEETDTIFQTNIWSRSLDVNSFFHIFFIRQLSQ